MERSGIIGILFSACEWMMRLAYVNLLWILFTLAGLIVFGLSPATVALFGVSRKWVQGDLHISVFRTFLDIYKKEFVKSNIIGAMLILTGFVLYFYSMILQSYAGLTSQFLLYVLFGLALIFVVIILYIFPVYVHFELKIFEYIKYALLIGLSKFRYTIIMVIGMLLINYLLYFWVPGLLPFFGLSASGLFIMFIANQVFTKIEQRQEKSGRKI